MDLEIIEDADVDERAVLLVSGSVDIASRGKLLAAGRESLARDDVDGLILDLRGVNFLDSVGIGAFVDLSHDAEDREATFAIRNPSPRVQRLVELIGLADTWSMRRPAPEPDDGDPTAG